VRGSSAPSSRTAIDLRQASSCVVDLAQVQQRPLRDPTAADPAILYDAPVTVLFAVLLARGVAEKHDGCAL